MSAIGPQLPPGVDLQRRTRSRSDSGSSSRSFDSSSSRSPSPSGSGASSHPRTRPTVAGPQLPSDFIRSRSASASPSRSQRESSDDEEGPSVGPALPSVSTLHEGLNAGAKAFLEREARRNAAEQEAKLAAEKAANSRPEWMLLPPSLSNASSLQAVAGDPLNLKSRGFAQSTPRVSARGGGASAEDADTSLWTETPEERMKRMQDEVSGVRAKGSSVIGDKEALERERSARRDSSIAAAMADGRSGKKSLVDEHNERRRRELKDKLEDESREERRREKRRRHDDDKDDRRSSRHSHSDEHRRRRHRSRSRSPDTRAGHSSSSHRHRSSRRDDSHRSHGSSRRHAESSDDEQRRRERRRRKESDSRREKETDRDRGKDRKSSKTRKEREEEDVRSGKAAAPMIWDRDAALSVGGRLMDEKKRGKMVADANALGDRFGSGSRRFL